MKQILIKSDFKLQYGMIGIWLLDLLTSLERSLDPVDVFRILKLNSGITNDLIDQVQFHAPWSAVSFNRKAGAAILPNVAFSGLDPDRIFSIPFWPQASYAPPLVFHWTLETDEPPECFTGHPARGNVDIVGHCSGHKIGETGSRAIVGRAHFATVAPPPNRPAPAKVGDLHLGFGAAFEGAVVKPAGHAVVFHDLPGIVGPGETRIG